MDSGALHQTQASGADDRSLWSKAPAWRNLTIAASLLTCAALALPQVIPAEQAQPAPAQMAATPAAHNAAPVTPPSLAAPQQPAPAHHTAAPKLASIIAPPAPAPQPAMPATAVPAPVPASTAPQTAPASNACLLAMPAQPMPRGSGTVFGFWTPEQARARVTINEARNGGTLNPAYRDKGRAMIRVDGDPNPNRYEISTVPNGMTVNLGDHVYFNTAYRDTSLPCSYFPTLISHDDGQLQKSTPSQLASATPQPVPSPAEAAPADLANLPVGTQIVPSGLLARVNRHNQYSSQLGGDLPITITVISAPTHGTISTKQGKAVITYPNAGARVSTVTNVFYQSAPGYVGQDSFTYKRTSPDPNDPRNANTYTVHVYVK